MMSFQPNWLPFRVGNLIIVAVGWNVLFLFDMYVLGMSKPGPGAFVAMFLLTVLAFGSLRIRTWETWLWRPGRSSHDSRLLVGAVGAISAVLLVLIGLMRLKIIGGM